MWRARCGRVRRGAPSRWLSERPTPCATAPAPSLALCCPGALPEALTRPSPSSSCWQPLRRPSRGLQGGKGSSGTVFLSLSARFVRGRCGVRGGHTGPWGCRLVAMIVPRHDSTGGQQGLAPGVAGHISFLRPGCEAWGALQLSTVCTRASPGERGCSIQLHSHPFGATACADGGKSCT